MPETPRKLPPHGFILAIAALLGFVAPLLAGGRSQLAISALVCVAAVSVLLHFGGMRRAQARAALRSCPSGRIVERVADEDARVFELPSAGIEPWRADAWVIGVVGGAALFLGFSAESLARPLTFMLVLISGALALRLMSVNSDHIRLEISKQGYRVQAHEGGRVIRRAGSGPLFAELLADALVLWSRDGRVGVLRGELEAGERAWLAAQLPAATEALASAADPAGGEVKQPEPGEHG